MKALIFDGGWLVRFYIKIDKSTINVMLKHQKRKLYGLKNPTIFLKLCEYIPYCISVSIIDCFAARQNLQHVFCTI